MDGLRGFLALAVVFHHVAIYHQFLQHASLTSRAWSVPPSRFYHTLGMAGMSMFFMITGYLFWSRLLKQQGRPGWTQLYVGRIFRIGPLYVAALAVASVCDFLSRTPVPSTPLWKLTATWSLLGLSVFPDRHEFLAGVTWSIQDEWLFYLSLPLLAFLAARSRHHLALTLLLLAIPLVLIQTDFHHAGSAPLQIHLVRPALFFAGMVCASLHRSGFKPPLPDWLASCLVVASVASTLLFHDIFTPAPLLLLGLAFFLIASGCSVWGMLTSRPAIRLGDVSYGVYVLQGLALATLFRPPLLRAFALSSPWHHWSLALLAMLLLVMLATATHVLIERPGIALGRRLIATKKAL